MLRLALTILVLTSLVPTARHARACGGFFCNAQTPVPIVQAGERVLFAPHDGRVTMHIEIVYSGDPTKFGWILPIAELPMDAAGRPLPLDKAVEISSQLLFTTLQSLTDPRFVLVRDPDDTTTCPSPPFSVETTAETESSPLFDASTGNPPVTVLQEAAIGPYDAQLIQADRSDALYTWLGENGYIQDPKAQPILDHYLQKGFKFLGIRLQSGRTTGELRPLAITLGEDAPCVPLVLTQIAATPDMPILVWVLGQSRAIPKNFLHAVIDERAFPFPGGAGYQSLVTQAIIDAGRRAWVTEYAGDSSPLLGSWLRPDTSFASAHGAKNLAEILDALANIGVPISDPDVAAIVRSNVRRPEDLRGFPFGNCMQCQGCDWAEASCEQQGLPNADHVTTDAEFYSAITYWAGLAAEGQVALDVDVQALIQAFEDELFTPRRNIALLFQNAPYLTRFFTLIDPEDMTRDPVFAFNPDLPEVSNVHTAMFDVISCDGTVRVTYATGRPYLQSCPGCVGFGGNIPAVPGVSALFQPEVLDESGPPVAIALDQVAEVDRILDNALPGLPTLPPGFEAKPDDPIDPPATVPDPTRDSGCSGGSTTLIGLLGLARYLQLKRPRRTNA